MPCKQRRRLFLIVHNQFAKMTSKSILPRNQKMPLCFISLLLIYVISINTAAVQCRSVDNWDSYSTTKTFLNDAKPSSASLDSEDLRSLQSQDELHSERDFSQPSDELSQTDNYDEDRRWRKFSQEGGNNSDIHIPFPSVSVESEKSSISETVNKHQSLSDRDLSELQSNSNAELSVRNRSKLFEHSSLKAGESRTSQSGHPTEATSFSPHSTNHGTPFSKEKFLSHDYSFEGIAKKDNRDKMKTLDLGNSSLTAESTKRANISSNIFGKHSIASDSWRNTTVGNAHEQNSQNISSAAMLRKARESRLNKTIDILSKVNFRISSTRTYEGLRERESDARNFRNGSLERRKNAANDPSVDASLNSTTFENSPDRNPFQNVEADGPLPSSGGYLKNPDIYSAVTISEVESAASAENQKFLQHRVKDMIQLKDPAAYVDGLKYDSSKSINQVEPEATRSFMNFDRPFDFRDVLPKFIKKQLEGFAGDVPKQLVEEGQQPSMHVLQQWENLEESFRESVEAVVRQALPLLIRASSEIQLSVGCYTSFFQLLLGLRRLRPWAFQMIDAFGKPPAGMLQGTVTSFGAYDECVNIVADSELRETPVGQQYFRGKYCTVEIKPPLPPKPQHYTMYQPVSVLANFSSSNDNVVRQAARQAHAFYFLTYRVDVCVPSSCTQDDVNNMAQFAAKYVEIAVTVPRCSVKEILPMDKMQIAVLCILGILAAFVLLGTAMDAFKEISKFSILLQKIFTEMTVKVLSCFSLNSNADMLFNSPSQDGLNALHGMRFFAMAWLVLGHTYFSSNVQMYGNLREANAFARGFLFQVIVNSTISLDTFFFISGVLLSYLTFQHDGKKNGVYNISRLFIRRYIRIVPSYLMIIGTTFLLPHLGSGPFWNETVDPVVENCRKRWWTNLLFVNNLVTTPELRCLEHSWYLSCDFQLFVIAVFLLLVFSRRPTLGIAINVFLIVTSVVLTGLLTYYYNVPPTLLASFPDPEERKYLNHVIISKPICHLGPYCIGLITGYFFSKCRKIRMKIYHYLIGWGISLSVTAAVVYGVLEWNKGNMPSKPVALIYAATHRTAWALGLAWMTAVCIAGHGGIINRILSWGVFIPLSRLTHIVYLVHPLIQYILTGYIRERLQTNHIILAYFFFGHIMTSYALSCICFFLFDGPTSAIVRTFFGETSLSMSQKSESSTSKGKNAAK